MKFAVKTVRFAAFPGLLLAPAPAAELNSGFTEKKWATPADQELNSAIT